MATKWREVALEEVAEDITVGHVGSMASEYVADGIPFLRSQNVEPLRIIDSDIKYITPAFHGKLKKSALSPGDVVIVRTGKPGACAVIPRTIPVANCSDLVIVRCGQHLDPHFLSYYVNSAATHHVNSHLVGAVQQHFNVGSARKLVLRLPELSEQRAIAHILGTLDGKIQLNLSQNETLEAIARTLFKSWFVDFDPVREKANGRDTGLPQQLSALFPTGITGEAPTGWQVHGLDGIATYLNGLAMQKFPPDGGESLPVIKIAQLRQGNTEGADRASIRLDPTYVVADGDVLFSWSGSLEVEIWCGGSGALNQHLFKVIPNRVPKWFAFLWTRHHLPDFRLTAAGKATTMGHIQRHHLAQAKALLPPPELLAEMDKVFSPLIDQIVRNKLEMRSLGLIRDALLPKLLSGELALDASGSILSEIEQ